MKVEESPIIIEQVIERPSSLIWKVITELEHMRKWFFDNIPDFEAKVGFKTSFNISTGQRNFKHLWEIIEVVPGRLIKYNWKYEGFSGNSNVEFNLTDLGLKTSIRIEVIILEDFPDSIPEFTLESCKTGWEYFLQLSLKNYVDNHL